MNIYIEGFAFLIEILVFLFYFLNRKSIIKYNKIYLLLNLMTTISSILYLIMVLVVKYHGISNAIYVLGHFYLISFLLQSFCVFVYSIKEIYKRSVKNHEIILIVSHIVVLIGIFLCVGTNLEINLDELGQPYLYGWSCFSVYSFSLAFLIFNLCLTLYRRSKVNRRKVLGITIYIVLWLISEVFQILVDIVIKSGEIIYFCGLSAAIGSLILYALIENPENNTDSLYGVLNEHAFYKFANQIFKNKRHYDVVIVLFDKSYYTTRDDFTEVLVAGTHLLNKSVDKIFKYDSSTFIIFRNRKRTSDVKEAIRKVNYMLSDYSPDTSLIHSNIKIIPRDYTFNSAKDFIRDVVEIVKTNNFDNTVKILSEIDILRIENSIRISEIVDQSIKFKHLKMNYQGIYSKEKKRIVAAEALIRLTDNEGNTIYPVSFIPMIEQDGRIIELGKLIFENVCDFISRNNLEELGLEYIEVNISPNQIQDPNFVDDYISLMKKYNVNPKYINFEITETSKGTSKACIDKIKKLRELGITFSLDDFGTGNSNLNYIVDMPIDIVKFDKTMVSKYFSNDIASVVVDYSIKMIKGLGYKIVFEGVEQLYEVEKINNMDVDYIQGYYYSKPVGEHEFIERLKESNKKI